MSTILQRINLPYSNRKINIAKEAKCLHVFHKIFFKIQKRFYVLQNMPKKNNLNSIDQKPNNCNYKSLNKALT